MPQVQAQLSLLTSTRRRMACARHTSNRFHSASSVIGKKKKKIDRLLKWEFFTWTRPPNQTARCYRACIVSFTDNISQPLPLDTKLSTKPPSLRWSNALKHMTFCTFILWWHWTLKRRQNCLKDNLFGTGTSRLTSIITIYKTLSFIWDTMCVVGALYVASVMEEPFNLPYHAQWIQSEVL